MKTVNSIENFWFLNFFKSEYLELLNKKEQLDQQVKDVKSNDGENENSINRLTKENNDLKREIEEMKVSNFYKPVGMWYCLKRLFNLV